MLKLRPFIPLLLFLFALAVRLIAIQLTQFEGLYGQDSFAYWQYALDLRQALGDGQLPPPFFWPIGYPAFVALATLVVGAQASAGQWVSVLAGAAVAPLVYALVLATSRDPSAPPRGALLAGLLAAVSAQLLLSSLSAMADTAALLWGTLSALCLIRYQRHFSWPWLALAATTLAFALLTRWVYALLAFPWGLSCLWAWHAAGLPVRQRLGTAALAVLIGGSILALHFMPDLLRGEFSYTGDLAVYRWHPAYALQNEQVNADGRFQYEYRTGHFYARPTFHPAYVFPLLVPFWLMGTWWVARQKQAALAILLLGWPLLTYLFLAGVPWQNWRFPLTFFPPLLVLMGLGFDWVWGRLDGRWRPWLLVYCAIALLGSGLWAVRDVGNFVRWANHNKEIALAVKAYMPPEATLLAFDLTATVRHYTAVDTHELFVLTEQDLRQIVGEETAVYLLLNPVNVQTQWVGKSPQQNLAWLQTNTILTPIAHYPPYVLYQVTP